jgi:hypothetical protein
MRNVPFTPSASPLPSDVGMFAPTISGICGVLESHLSSPLNARGACHTVYYPAWAAVYNEFIVGWRSGGGELLQLPKYALAYVSEAGRTLRVSMNTPTAR